LVTRSGGAQQPLTATVEIDAGHVEGSISPLLYGQFAEFMFENIKQGMHAELILNRSFEEQPNTIGLSRYWERYPDDRNDDYAISFAWDSAVAYPTAGLRVTTNNEQPATANDVIGGHSLRIELRPGVIERHGIYQSRMPVKQGAEYRGYLWLKGESFSGSVSVSLEADVTGGRVYGEAQATNVGSDWKKYPFTVRPTATDPLARFAILFSGTGKLWVDQVSLMPANAVDDVRADVWEKIKALAPAFVRWPGGNVAQDYHWRWGVGPRDERPTWVNLSWKNEREPSDFGTDEFVKFARNVGAEPTITVNVDGRGATAKDAAEWVEYSKGRVTYWEIGNEIWGDWVRGHSDADTYARNLVRYVAAMRAANPSIKVIAVGDNNMDWNRTVLKAAADSIDYLAIHHYYGRREMNSDVRNLLARPLHHERQYGEIDAMLRELAPNRRLQLAINEWGLDVPESQQYSVLAALYGARLMNVFERRGNLVGMSAVSDLVNGWPGGIIQASRHGVFVTPIYLVNQLYATHLGAQRVAARVDGPVFATSREGTHVPTLDVVSTRSADGRTMFIKAVNTDLERPLAARVTVRGARPSARATVARVVADSIHAANSFATPDAVKITREEIRVGQTFTLDMPRHSVAVVTLNLAP
jgi:alpha-N-arabinofuranosidase